MSPWAPNDARPDSAGNIWWTDYYSPSLARIDTTANPVSMTTWNLSAWIRAGASLAGLAMDAGEIWLAESDWDETSAGRLLYRFRSHRQAGSAAIRCLSGEPPSASFTTASSWLADWVLGRIVRINPASLQVTYWPTATVPDRGAWPPTPAGTSGGPKQEEPARWVGWRPPQSHHNLQLAGVGAMHRSPVEGSRIWYTAEELQADYAGNVGILEVPGQQRHGQSGQSPDLR